MKNNYYITFTERNEWEGETWNFYLPVYNNEKAIKLLQKKIKELEEYESCYDFNLLMNKIPEDEVDILIKHSKSGYMNEHQKLSGKIDLDKLQSISSSDLEGLLYKGGIRNLLKGKK